MTDSKSRYKKLLGSFKSPIQLTALIGTVSAIVGFIILFKGNFYLTSIVIIILALAWLLRFCIKLAFSKTEPLVVGGKGVYEYQTERPYALSGVILIPLLMMSGFVYLFTQGKPIVSQAIFGTFTPSPTNTLPPSLAPTLTATLTPVPDAYSLYYLFILDASSRMLANFNESETKWQDLQASALNHLIYGLPDRANYGLIVLGGNLVNSTGTCDNPNQEVVTLGLNMKTTLIETIENVQPYGVASLADAITLARDIFERQQGDVHRKLMLFLGGGDECADDKWMALEYFLKDYKKSELIDVFTEVVILPDETIDPVVFTDLQTEITRLGIENEVAINAPKDNQELQAVLGNIYSQSMDQARQYEPAAVAAQEAINETRTAIPAPVYVPSKTATIAVVQPGITQQSIVTSAPLAAPTNTPKPLPTAPPPPTSTSAPPPTEAPKPFLILAPGNGTAYGCSSDSLCIQTVTVQWVPEGQTGGRYLSIWVRPLPDDPNQDYYVQASPYFIGGSQWTSTEVYLGQIGDPAGTPFKVCALVTGQAYSRGDYYYTLPAAFLSYCVDVTR